MTLFLYKPCSLRFHELATFPMNRYTEREMTTELLHKLYTWLFTRSLKKKAWVFHQRVSSGKHMLFCSELLGWQYLGANMSTGELNGRRNVMWGVLKLDKNFVKGATTKNSSLLFILGCWEDFSCGRDSTQTRTQCFIRKAAKSLLVKFPYYLNIITAVLGDGRRWLSRFSPWISTTLACLCITPVELL